MITLRGITWNHTRGYVPLVAASQRFAELHGIQIEWRVRTLQEFADFPIQRLAETYDLLIIDHPFVGFAAARHAEGAPVLLPLDGLLAEEFLADQARNSVGVSHASYNYGGHQWAAAIDAATPVASWRADLLAEPPQTWEQLLDLANRGAVGVPAIPVDCFMNFLMLCVALGEEPAKSGRQLVSEQIGVAALERLRDLVGRCSTLCLERNPIATYEALSRGEILYCPFAYGYSNYARRGYAAERLLFGGLVSLQGRRLRSTLGGTGLAISARCEHLDAAVAFTEYVTGPLCQSTLYTHSGGQPGHRAAWLDAQANALCGNFFADTLQTLDEAYLRPRYDGYLHLQDEAGPVVHRYLVEGGDARACLAELDAIYKGSLPDPLPAEVKP